MIINTARTKSKSLDCLNITVSEKDPIGKFFAPTWEMVFDLKNKKISEEEYENKYHQMMIDSYFENRDIWDEILSRKSVTLTCFCHKDRFCHRFLLADYFIILGAEEGKLI